MYALTKCKNHGENFKNCMNRNYLNEISVTKYNFWFGKFKSIWNFLFLDIAQKSKLSLEQQFSGTMASGKARAPGNYPWEITGQWGVGNEQTVPKGANGNARPEARLLKVLFIQEIRGCYQNVNQYTVSSIKKALV